MSTFDIASGQSLDLSPSPPQDRPPVTPQTPAYPPQPERAGEQGGVCDATEQRLEQLAQGRHNWAAAQAAGHATESGRRGGYEASMLPLAAEYGDLMPLPDVISDSSKHTGSPGSANSGPAG